MGVGYNSLFLLPEFKFVLSAVYNDGKVNIKKPEVIDSLDILGMKEFYGVQVAYPMWGEIGVSLSLSLGDSYGPELQQVFS